MGAYELSSSATLTCDFLGVPAAGPAPLEVVFAADVLGPTNGLYCWWDFDDDGSADAEGADRRHVTNVFASGLYTVRLTVSNSVGTVTDQVRSNYILSVPQTIYVATNGAAEVPYDTWGKAATNLNDAVAVQQSGGLILVSNGVHAVTAEVTLARGVIVRGMNGPDHTVIHRTAGEFRIFSLTHSEAVLDGLTIANGSPGYGLNGGCVWMSGGVVSNCVVRDGYTYRGGGSGIYMTGGVVTHSTIVTNRGGADQSGRYASGGGGVYIAGGVLEYSRIVSNRCNGANDTQPLGGGGVRAVGGVVRNCLIWGNSVTESRGYGGGVGVSGSGIIVTCTIAGNRAEVSGGGVSSINVAGGYLTNCIVYGNESVPLGSPQDIDEPGIASYSCSPDLPDGVGGNIADDPRFEDSGAVDYRLRPGSSCLNAGIVQPWMLAAADLDGNPRLRKNRVDMGCYQALPPPGSIFFIR